MAERTFTFLSHLPWHRRLWLRLGGRPRTEREAIASIRDHHVALGMPALRSDEEVAENFAAVSDAIRRLSQSLPTAEEAAEAARKLAGWREEMVEKLQERDSVSREKAELIADGKEPLPGSLAEAHRDLSEAMRTAGLELACALRIDRLTDWLTRRLRRFGRG